MYIIYIIIIFYINYKLYCTIIYRNQLMRRFSSDWPWVRGSHSQDRVNWSTRFVFCRWMNSFIFAGWSIRMLWHMPCGIITTSFCIYAEAPSRAYVVGIKNQTNYICFCMSWCRYHFSSPVFCWFCPIL